MTVTISLPPEAERKLAERAAASGQDVPAYVHQLIQKDIDQPSFAELFAPVHAAVRESGIQQGELDNLIQKAVTDSRRERRAKRPT
jgi:hypothetical protein